MNSTTTMPNPGNGTNVAGDTPQEVLFIVTDGVVDEINSSTCSQDADRHRAARSRSTRRCARRSRTAASASPCSTPTYLAVTNDGWYNDWIAPFNPASNSQISTQLQACASTGLFYEAASAADLGAALSTLFNTVTQTRASDELSPRARPTPRRPLCPFSHGAATGRAVFVRACVSAGRRLDVDARRSALRQRCRPPKRPSAVTRRTYLGVRRDMRRRLAARRRGCAAEAVASTQRSWLERTQRPLRATPTPIDAAAESALGRTASLARERSWSRLERATTVDGRVAHATVGDAERPRLHVRDDAKRLSGGDCAELARRRSLNRRLDAGGARCVNCALAQSAAC